MSGSVSSTDTPDRIQGGDDTGRLVDLARRIATYPSQIPSEAGLATFLADHLHRRDTFDDVRLQHVTSGRANVVAVLRGTGTGPNLLFNGHLDIPGVNAGWTRDPYGGEVDNGRIYGVGMTDMKGALASMVEAIEAVAQSPTDRSGDIVLSAVIHHNVCGLGTKFFLSSWEGELHGAINGEPTNLAIQLAHGGAWQFRWKAWGRAAHTSRSGVNAIEGMMAALSRLTVDRLTFDTEQRIDGLPRVMVGRIEGGQKPSYTAESCIVEGDVRLLPGMTEESLREDLRSIGEEVVQDFPELRMSIDTLSYQRPFIGNRRDGLVRTLEQAHRRVHGSPVLISAGLPASAYVTDASDLARAGIPTVVYGPGDWRSEPDESIAIDDLVTAAKVYALVAADFVSRATAT